MWCAFSATFLVAYIIAGVECMRKNRVFSRGHIRNSQVAVGKYEIQLPVMHILVYCIHKLVSCLVFISTAITQIAQTQRNSLVSCVFFYYVDVLFVFINEKLLVLVHCA